MMLTQSNENELDDNQLNRFAGYVPNGGRLEIQLDSEEQTEPLLPVDEEVMPLSRSSFIPSSLNRVGMGLLIGVIAVVVAGVTYANGKSNREKLTPQTEESPTSQVESPGEEVDTGEVGRLKAKLAFEDQTKQVDKINQTPVPPPKAVTPNSTVSTTVNRPVSRSIPSSAVRVSSPPPPPTVSTVRATRTVSRTVPQRGNLSAYVPVGRSFPNYRSYPLPLQRTSPEVDPQAAWLAAAGIGSYGSGTQQQVREETQQGGEPQDSLENPTANSNPSEDQTQWETPILQGRPQNILTVPMGAKIRAQIIRGFAWDSSMPIIGEQVALRLIEPILSDSGEVVAATGSLLSSQVMGTTDTGLVKLQVDSVVVSQGKNSQEQEIKFDPKGIMVGLPNGRPIIAERIEQGGTQQGPSLGGSAVEALGVLVPLLGSGSGNNGYQSMYQMRALEDFYKKTFEGQQSSNYYQRPTVLFVINEGTEVQLYINKTLTIRR